MNLVSAMLLWLVGSTIIQVVVDNFTGYQEDFVKNHGVLNRVFHELSFSISGMVLMYILMTY